MIWDNRTRAELNKYLEEQQQSIMRSVSNMAAHGGNMAAQGGNMAAHGGNMVAHGGNMAAHTMQCPTPNCLLSSSTG